MQVLLGVIVLTWSDIIAIYAGLVATLVAFIEVIRLRKELRNRLVVRATLHTEFPIYQDNRLGNGTNVIVISIVNDSPQTRYIQRPMFKLNKTISTGITFSFVPDGSPNYPISLAPGDVHTAKIASAQVLNLVKGTRVSKIKGAVWDTVNREYSSKWIQVKIIQP